MCLHIAALPQGLFPEHRSDQPHGFANRYIVSDTRSGNGFLIAIGIDENITYAAINIRTEFKRECIVKQDQKLRAFSQCKPAVFCERPACTPMVGFTV